MNPTDAYRTNSFTKPFLLLYAAFALLACKKNNNDAAVPMQIGIRLVDSLGNFVFPNPNPSPNFYAQPFDPTDSYWIDGSGKKEMFNTNSSFASSQFGITFGIDRTESEIRQDPSWQQTQTLHWQIVLHPDSAPIPMIVYMPDWSKDLPEYVVLKGDSFFLRTLIENIITFQYP